MVESKLRTRAQRHPPRDLRTSMVTILNHYGPRSEDAWLASLLMQALRDLLPGMFGAELGFLVSLGCYVPRCRWIFTHHKLIETV